MYKILEKLNGKRIVLVCEKVKAIPENSRLVLEGCGGTMAVDNYDMPMSRECFSPANTTLVILPEKYNMADLEKFDTMYFDDIPHDSTGGEK